MKIFVNRTPINHAWGGGALFSNALFDHVNSFGHEILSSVSKDQQIADVYLIAGIDQEGQNVSAHCIIEFSKLLKQRYGTAPFKTILRINENDARKGTFGVDQKVMDVARHCDGVVFVSEWLRSYYRDVAKLWNDGIPSTVIYNGVDGTIYKPNKKFNNGKINIVSHHWSSHHLKGFDFYEQIDEFVGENDNFTFTYIGRDRGTFRNSRVIPPLFGSTLGEELGKYDVYVSASRWDPGPNHCAESISCEIPTYVHEHGGGCVEFAGSDHVYRNWEELQKILVDRQFTSNSTRFSTWADCTKRYIDFIQKIVEM